MRAEITPDLDLDRLTPPGNIGRKDARVCKEVRQYVLTQTVTLRGTMSATFRGSFTVYQVALTIVQWQIRPPVCRFVQQDIEESAQLEFLVRATRQQP